MPRRALLGVAGNQALDNEPHGPTTMFETSFESGDFTQYHSCQWTGRNDDCQGYNGTSNYSATVVAIDGRPHVARFEVRNGDVPPFGGGERAEVAEANGTGINDGDEIWIGLDVKFPSDFPNPSVSSNWHIIYQWHSLSSSASPPLTLDVGSDGNLYLTNDNINHRTEIGPIVRGLWVRYVLHIKASPDDAIGFGEVWQNGELVLPQHPRATLADTQSHYTKHGIYRDSANTATSIVYMDNLRITADLA